MPSATQALPARHQPALGHDVLDGQRVPDVVAPGSVDVEVLRVVRLFAEAELLHHPTAGSVLRPDVDLDAVQAAGGEAVVDREREGGRGDPAPGVPGVDPVPGVRGAE